MKNIFFGRLIVCAVFSDTNLEQKTQTISNNLMTLVYNRFHVQKFSKKCKNEFKWDHWGADQKIKIEILIKVSHELSVWTTIETYRDGWHISYNKIRFGETYQFSPEENMKMFGDYNQHSLWTPYTNQLTDKYNELLTALEKL